MSWSFIFLYNDILYKLPPYFWPHFDSSKNISSCNFDHAEKEICTWVLEQALSVVTGLLKFVHLHLGVSCRDTFITWLLVCGFHFILCNCLDQDRDLNLSGNIPAKIIVKGTWKSSQPISRSTACRLSPALYLTVFFSVCHSGRSWQAKDSFLAEIISKVVFPWL